MLILESLSFWTEGFYFHQLIIKSKARPFVSPMIVCWWSYLENVKTCTTKYGHDHKVWENILETCASIVVCIKKKKKKNKRKYKFLASAFQKVMLRYREKWTSMPSCINLLCFLSIQLSNQGDSAPHHSSLILCLLAPCNPSACLHLLCA